MFIMTTALYDDMHSLVYQIRSYHNQGHILTSRTGSRRTYGQISQISLRELNTFHTHALLLFVSYLLLLCKVVKPRWNCRTWFEDRPIRVAVERVVAGISISILNWSGEGGLNIVIRVYRDDVGSIVQ